MSNLGITNSHSDSSGGIFGQIELTPLWEKDKFAKSKGNSQSGMVTTGLRTDPSLVNAKIGIVNGAVASSSSQALGIIYGSAGFDYSLQQITDPVLRLDNVPSHLTVKYWADAQGKFFLYFQGGIDGEAPHYLPSTARQIWINGRTLIDLDQKRLRVAVMLMQAAQEKIQVGALPEHLLQNGFGNLTLDKGSDNVLAYFGRIMTLGDLAPLQVLLFDAVQYARNPNLKVWLADIYTACAGKSALDGSTRSSTNNWENEETQSYLTEAFKLTNSAQVDCMSAFLRMCQAPPAEKYLPFEPFDINQYGGYGWKFYAGAYDQARVRNRGLAKLQNAILAHMAPIQILKMLGLDGRLPL